MGHTGKIPVTFVNQTVASRKAAAIAKKKKNERLDLNNRVGRSSRSQSASRSGSDRVEGMAEGESEGGSRPSSAGQERGGRSRRREDKTREDKDEEKESGVVARSTSDPPVGGNGAGASGSVRMLLPKA
jgi:hypothetical protein